MIEISSLAAREAISQCSPPKMTCRILYLIGELHTGGAERQLYYLLRELDRDHYMPAVAVWNFNETDVHVARIRELGVPPIPFRSGFRLLGSFLRSDIS